VWNNSQVGKEILTGNLLFVSMMSMDLDEDKEIKSGRGKGDEEK